jgi:hypothetical protein
MPLIAVDVCAELVTFKFTGTVTSVSVNPLFQSYDFPDVGDSFNGSYTFDSRAPDTESSQNGGLWHNVIPHKPLEISIGDYYFRGPASTILTAHDYYSVGDWIPSIELTSNPALGQALRKNNFLLVVQKDDLFWTPTLYHYHLPRFKAHWSGISVW